MYVHMFVNVCIGYSCKAICALALCSQNSELYIKKGKFYYVNLPPF